MSMVRGLATLGVSWQLSDTNAIVILILILMLMLLATLVVIVVVLILMMALILMLMLMLILILILNDFSAIETFMPVGPTKINGSFTMSLHH